MKPGPFQPTRRRSRLQPPSSARATPSTPQQLSSGPHATPSSPAVVHPGREQVRHSTAAPTSPYPRQVQNPLSSTPLRVPNVVAPQFTHQHNVAGLTSAPATPRLRSTPQRAAPHSTNGSSPLAPTAQLGSNFQSPASRAQNSAAKLKGGLKFKSVMPQTPQQQPAEQGFLLQQPQPAQSLQPTRPIQGQPAEPQGQRRPRSSDEAFVVLENPKLAAFLHAVHRYMMETCPVDAYKFMDECQKLYKDQYRRKRKERNSSASREGAQNAAVEFVIDAQGEEFGAEMEIDVNETIPSEAGDQFISRFSSDDPNSHRKAHLEQLILNRRLSYDNVRKIAEAARAQGTTNLAIWENENKDRVVLSSDVCERVPVLCNQAAKPTPVFEDVLRFLWHYLIEDGCAGAILQHPLGFPRIEILWMFCSTAISKNGIFGNGSTKILIVTPALREWQDKMSRIDHDEIIKIADLDSYQVEIKRWRQKGGVLLCGVDVLDMVTGLEQSRKKARKELLDSLLLGPHIVILDQALTLASVSSDTQRLLDRIATPRRLALSSMPLEEHLLESWHVLRWVVADLIGDSEEYWEVFVRRIAMGNSAESDEEAKAIAKSAAHYLLRTWQFLTHSIDSSSYIKTLQERNCRVLECNVVLDISSDHDELYKKSTKSIMDMVHDNKLSGYLGAQLLLTAASSGSALAVLLEEWSKGPVPEDTLQNWSGAGNEVLREAVKGTQESAKQLRESIGDLLMQDIKSTKLELLVSVALHCLELNKRLVIFGNSPYVRRKVKSALISALDNGEQRLFSLEPFMPVKNRASQLAKFNAAEDGALLLAPFGSEKDCVEESGWGYIKTSHVLVTDMDINLTSATQIIERTCRLGSVGVVVVYNLISASTIEVALQQKWKMDQPETLVVPEIRLPHLLERDVEPASRFSEFLHLPLIDLFTRETCDAATAESSDIISHSGFDLEHVSFETSTIRYFAGKMLHELTPDIIGEKSVWQRMQDVQMEFTVSKSKDAELVLSHFAPLDTGPVHGDLQQILPLVWQARAKFENIELRNGEFELIMERWRPHFHMYEERKQKERPSHKRRSEDAYEHHRGSHSRPSRRGRW